MAAPCAESATESDISMSLCHLVQRTRRSPETIGGLCKRSQTLGFAWRTCAPPKAGGSSPLPKAVLAGPKNAVLHAVGLSVWLPALSSAAALCDRRYARSGIRRPSGGGAPWRAQARTSVNRVNFVARPLPWPPRTFVKIGAGPRSKRAKVAKVTAVCPSSDLPAAVCVGLPPFLGLARSMKLRQSSQVRRSKGGARCLALI